MTFRHSRRARCSTLLAATGVLLGCGDTVLHPGEALELSVAVAQPVLQLGDSTRVTMRLRNRGVQPIVVTTGGCLLLPYVVESVTEQIVYPTGGSWGCFAVVRTLRLAPGADYTEQIALHTGATGRLARGEYEVYATLESNEFSLQSARVALTVR